MILIRVWVYRAVRRPGPVLLSSSTRISLYASSLRNSYSKNAPVLFRLQPAAPASSRRVWCIVSTMWRQLRHAWNIDIMRIFRAAHAFFLRVPRISTHV